MLLIVGYPTVDETREAAAAGNQRAIEDLSHAEEVARRRERAGGLELTEQSPLPALRGVRLEFEWDLEDVDGESWTVIRCDGQTIWRELAYYEGWERFNEVKRLLKLRYEEFSVLTPTERSELYLFGDDMFASSKLDLS